MTDLLQRYGPTAVVTGASSGIGFAIARELAAFGLDLILVARRSDELQTLSAELEGTSGIKCVALQIDLSDPHALPQALDELGADVGLCVAAAGFGATDPVASANLDVELNMVDVNCKSVLALSHWAVRHFASKGRGGLMLFSSILAFQGVRNSANYAATKAWNQVFAEGLAAENTWIDVLSVAPGPTSTGFGARSGMDTSSGASPEAVAKAAVRALPKGGTVRPTAMNKFLQGGLAMLPRGARTWVISKATATMIKPTSVAQEN
jgi:hypothetical protein